MNKQKKKSVNMRGITLIALVITIIVLLILAGVTISTLSGNNGILTQAGRAKIMSELGKVNEAIELYKSEQIMTNNYEDYTDSDLAQNIKLAKKLVINDTSRNVLIFKDLKEINTSSSIGEGYKNINLDSINAINNILELNDVYVKDLTDGTLYYIVNGEIYSIDGTTEIIKFPYKKVEGVQEEWKAVDNGDNTVTLVKYLGNNIEVVIPNYYEGKRVKSVKGEIESYSAIFPSDSTTVVDGQELPINTKIKKITISDGIQEIGDVTFLGCTAWTGDLIIPNSVTAIGSGAFANCISLNGKLTIGNNVTTIGVNAFWHCSALTGNLVIGDKVTTIGPGAFEGCNNLDGKLTIGNNVITIGDRAFIHCSKLKGDIIIPNSVTSIGELAFYNCIGFTGNLVIGDKVTTIGESAFDNCTGLTGELTLGKNVTTIGKKAFWYCPELTGKITIRKKCNSWRRCIWGW